jgi:hypothetical protein
VYPAQLKTSVLREDLLTAAKFETGPESVAVFWAGLVWVGGPFAARGRLRARNRGVPEAPLPFSFLPPTVVRASGARARPPIVPADQSPAKEEQPVFKSVLRSLRWITSCHRSGRTGRLRYPAAPVGRSRTGPTPGTRLFLHVLEDRSLPSTFVVTDLADSGPGSLRQAIQSADAQTGPATIRFAPTVRGTIGLTSGELDITGTVDIDGPGAGLLAVSGSKLSRVFEVSTGATVSLSGLTITGGSAVDFGGGILNAGTLTLTGVSVTGNVASQDSTANELFGGAGISNSGTLTIFGSRISSNTLNGTDPPNNSDNAITSGGGGINNDGSSAVLTVYNSVISNNTADDSAGVRNSDGAALTFIGVAVTNNTATETVAGGIGGDDATSAYIAYSLFQGNRVLGHSIDGGTGGGLDSESTNTTVIGSTFIDNSAATFGGGLNAFGGGTLRVSDTLIADNSATFGGGVTNLFGSSVVLDNSVLSGNVATVNGGAVYNLSAGLEIHNSVLIGNQAGNDGGGIDYAGGSSLVLTDVLITGNRANTSGGTGKGGGLFVAVPPKAPAQLTNAIIVGNTPDNVDGI